MKILYFTSESHPTFRADVLQLFGKYLPQFGVYSDLVTTTTELSASSWGGGKALVTYQAGSKQTHLKKWAHSLAIMVKASKKNYAAIQVRDMPIFALFALAVAKVKGLPYFYWMSYPIADAQMVRAKSSKFSLKATILWGRGFIGSFILRNLIFRFADHIFVQSDQMKTELIQQGIDSEKLTPVPMGVDIAGLTNAEIKAVDLAELKARRVLVYLGTLDAVRNIEVMFEMLALISKEIPEVLLILAGDTSDSKHRKWLQERASLQHVADRIIWTGWQPMHVAWGYVMAGEVALSPFPRGHLLDSASPTKVVEYLAMGKKVVCNDNPDQKYLIEKSGAGLCVPYTAYDFAQAVLTLMQESSQLSEQRLRAGKEIITKERDYSVIGQKLASTYSRLLQHSA